MIGLLVIVLLLIKSSYIRSYSDFGVQWEQYTNDKIPVSDFTYQYMKKNSNIACQNALFSKISVMSADELKLARTQPLVQKGTLLNTPRSYTSTWSFQ